MCIQKNVLVVFKTLVLPWEQHPTFHFQPSPTFGRGWIIFKYLVAFIYSTYFTVDASIVSGTCTIFIFIFTLLVFPALQVLIKYILPLSFHQRHITPISRNGFEAHKAYVFLKQLFCAGLFSSHTVNFFYMIHKKSLEMSNCSRPFQKFKAI